MLLRDKLEPDNPLMSDLNFFIKKFRKLFNRVYIDDKKFFIKLNADDFVDKVIEIFDRKNIPADDLNFEINLTYFFGGSTFGDFRLNIDVSDILDKSLEKEDVFLSIKESISTQVAHELSHLIQSIF